MTSPLVTDLRVLLKESMRSGDRTLTAAVRTLLGELANAEAVPAGGPGSGDEHIAGSVAGVGSTEAARRDLSPAEQEQIAAREVGDLRAAATSHRAAGRTTQAGEFERAADTLATLLDPR